MSSVVSDYKPEESKMRSATEALRKKLEGANPQVNDPESDISAALEFIDQLVNPDAKLDVDQLIGLAEVVLQTLDLKQGIGFLSMLQIATYMNSCK